MAAVRVDGKEISVTLFSVLLFVLILLFSLTNQGCEGGGGDSIPPDISLDSALVEELRAEYSTYGANTTPPSNAFTSWEYSGYYTFWDGDHITFGNGFALNTSDTNYSGIAILRYYAPNEKKAIDLTADVVINNYYDIDPNASGPVPISSAYRNPRRNNEKGGSNNSYHIYGRAIDFDTDDTVEHSQDVWDAASSTIPVEELLNGAPGRAYLTTRPSANDDPVCHWIHVAW